jgi:PEP-CTERM motif
MKKIITAVLVATASLVHAAPITTTFSTGDLFVGFSNGSKDFVIDIGAAAKTYNLGTLTIDLNSVLTSYFGGASGEWVTGGNTAWAVFGHDASASPVDKVWASTTVANLDLLNNNDAIAEAINAFGLGIDTVAVSYGAALTKTNISSGGNTFAAYSANNTTDANSWRAQDSVSGGLWSSGVKNAIAMTLVPSSDLTVNYFGTDVQTGNWAKIKVDNLGILTVVPEPSSYALLAMGFVAAAFFARRKISSIK